jgi:hypothetical protein
VFPGAASALPWLDVTGLPDMAFWAPVCSRRWFEHRSHLFIIGDARESPAQRAGARDPATRLEGCPDSDGLCLGDGKSAQHGGTDRSQPAQKHTDASGGEPGIVSIASGGLEWSPLARGHPINPRALQHDQTRSCLAQPRLCRVSRAARSMARRDGESIRISGIFMPRGLVAAARQGKLAPCVR